MLKLSYLGYYFCSVSEKKIVDSVQLKCKILKLLVSN
jgi:hypothetical protein